MTDEYERLAERVEQLAAMIEELREEMRAAVAGLGYIFEAGRAYERGNKTERATLGSRPANPHLRAVR